MSCVNRYNKKNQNREINLKLGGKQIMTIKFKGKKMENFEAKKQTYMDLMKAEDSTPEQMEEAFTEMFNALQEDLTEQISTEARNEVQDAQILTARGQNVLTSEERKFFNAAVEIGR